MLPLSAQVIFEVKEGLVLIIVGMGVVFFFLVIMIFAMQLMGMFINFLNRIFPPKLIQIPVKAQRTPKTDDEIAVAIAVAMAQR